MTVLVSDLNESPAFTGLSTAEDRIRTIAENTAAGTTVGAPFRATDPDGDTLTYFLSGADATSFDINASSGQLRTRAALDYETTPSYSLMVTVADPSNETDSVAVTITVLDVEERGTVTLSEVQPLVGDTLIATLADPDGAPDTVAWTWERSTSRTSGWAPVSGAGDGVTTSEYTPVTGDEDHYLRASASYDSKSASAVSANPVREEVPGNNNPSFFPAAFDSRRVDENVRAVRTWASRSRPRMRITTG